MNIVDDVADWCMAHVVSGYTHYVTLLDAVLPERAWVRHVEGELFSLLNPQATNVDFSPVRELPMMRLEVRAAAPFTPLLTMLVPVSAPSCFPCSHYVHRCFRPHRAWSPLSPKHVFV